MQSRNQTGWSWFLVGNLNPPNSQLFSISISIRYIHIRGKHCYTRDTSSQHRYSLTRKTSICWSYMFKHVFCKKKESCCFFSPYWCFIRVSSVSLPLENSPPSQVPIVNFRKLSLCEWTFLCCNIINTERWTFFNVCLKIKSLSVKSNVGFKVPPQNMNEYWSWMYR